MGLAVCRLVSPARSGPASIVISPHRPIHRLLNTIKPKYHAHAASSTSPPVSRARAASQCLKIAESCKRSSRHVRDLIRAEIPADKTDKEERHGAAPAPPASK